MSPTVYSAGGLLLHKTRTTPSDPTPFSAAGALAECVCGWQETAPHRRKARAQARIHLDTASPTLAFHPAAVSDQGPRQHNADAYAVHVDDTRNRAAWAVADGIGDNEHAAEAAAIAANAAVRAAVQTGAVDAVLAAGHEVHDYQIADTVLVVAAALPPEDGGGYDVAWVGDCRAWQWNGTTLTQLTVDHTQGQLYRDCGNPALAAIADAYDHVVMTTVATATVDDIGHTRTTGPHQRLLLASDGVSKPLPASSIARTMRTFGHQLAIASRLVHAARFHNGSDNATALAINPVFDLDTP
ncbi:hypothetical protein Lesp02_03130 [Lentzea sp. NBRC 105346]|uniref:PP2C family protein-serine/threonine phosphatase n=1 Tax=Lentzea sp. NBRC 105346 TaxID=3032205 RepID=UPI0024A04450|nr:protein phosphatase 2C domain-containing protein [Lentzea sp. NBRC 105346]GLZ28123.1 hypothetical protein Lesp02_03130 [Lentzea sp. NBRC 105346]